MAGGWDLLIGSFGASTTAYFFLKIESNASSKPTSLGFYGCLYFSNTALSYLFLSSAVCDWLDCRLTAIESSLMSTNISFCVISSWLYSSGIFCKFSDYLLSMTTSCPVKSRLIDSSFDIFLSILIMIEPYLYNLRLWRTRATWSKMLRSLKRMPMRPIRRSLTIWKLVWASRPSSRHREHSKLCRNWSRTLVCSSTWTAISFWSSTKWEIHKNPSSTRLSFRNSLQKHMTYSWNKPNSNPNSSH